MRTSVLPLLGMAMQHPIALRPSPIMVDPGLLHAATALSDAMPVQAVTARVSDLGESLRSALNVGSSLRRIVDLPGGALLDQTESAVLGAIESAAEKGLDSSVLSTVDSVGESWEIRTSRLPPCRRLNHQ